VTLVFICGIAVLALIMALAAAVQALYQESLRLRARELPALEFFKSNLEPRIGAKDDEAALSFGLIKHISMVMLGILVLIWLGPSHASWHVAAQAAFLGTLIMLTAAYGIPQILYRRTSGRWLTPLVPLLRFMVVVVKPLAVMLRVFDSLIALTNEKEEANDAPSPAENIEALISAGTEEGLIQEDDRKLIQSVVEFGDKVVREVMTARPNMVAILADASLDELRELVIHEQYSRIPAYEGTIDQIIGFVHVRDMFELDEEERARRTVRELVRPIRFVPESKAADDLLREMQQEGTHMVIVVDEYGNTAGLATMEDLVEVILGEIRDEHEPESDIEADGAGGYIVSGNFDVARLSDLLGFRPEEEIESTTVGGLIAEWLGRVPQRGEFVDRNGIRIEVMAGDELRVSQVRVSKSKAAVAND
jgi:CBS domain containing-hemolysin-like protein